MAELGSGNGTGYPAALDTDSAIEVNSPNAGKTKARAEVVNDLATALIAVQTELGTDPAGTLTDVKTFLQTEHNTDGTHNHRKNAIINGTGVVAQRGNYTLVKDAYAFGKCDQFEGMATGTAVSAGILTQTSNAAIGTTGFAHYFTSVTITGTGIIYHRTRIESKDAKRYKNGTASLSVKVYHDVGSDITYTLYVRKADAEDNFSATTEISNDGGTSVSSATATPLTFENISMGDCSNGIEVELKIECGAITSKQFQITEYQLELGANATSFEHREIGKEISLAQRYFCKSYDLGTAPGTATSTGMTVTRMTNLTSSDHAIFLATQFPVSMRVSPTITLYDAAGASGKVTMAAGNGITGSIYVVGTSGFTAQGTNGAASSNRQLEYHYTASAGL